MNISLISPFSSVQAIGIRTLSAVLKQAGHEVKLIFLPRTFKRPYNQRTLVELVELVEGSDLVGVTVMTNYFDNAVQITAALKARRSVPILWGGIHPTVRPEECLLHADLVCLGEAEETILELTRAMEEGRSCDEIPGLWSRREGGIARPPLRPPLTDLDAIPFQDYDWNTHYLLYGNRIQKMTAKLMKFVLRGDYAAHPSRGCPFRCTYCCNDALKRLYPEPHCHFRKRSMANVLRELQEAKTRMPFLRRIVFDDDAFFFYSEDELKTFSQEYRQKIGLPLDIRGVTPVTLARAKLAPLVEAGLKQIRMGIESGSQRSLDLYGRRYTVPQVEEATRLIAEFKQVFPRYDIIVNNPWETEEDLIETLLLLTRIPPPFELSLFSLVPYPGTALHEKAQREGKIQDELRDVYRKSYNVRAAGLSGKLVQESYPNNLLYLAHVYGISGLAIPEATMRTLIARREQPLRSRLLYAWMRRKAGWLLKKDFIKKLWTALRQEGSEEVARRLREGSFLD